MVAPAQLKEQIADGRWDAPLADLYGKQAVLHQRNRYQELVKEYSARFGGGGEAFLFSAPGRTEIGGNHTDHQRGRVLAAAINLDAAAVAVPNDSGVIHIKSAGHDENIVRLDQLEPVGGEENTSTALVRGIAARFHELGFRVGGFSAYTVSDVLRGSGLSSSAAFEVLVGTILNGLFNGGAVDPVTIAQIGQYAENRYFGKPCGLMDQTACSVGGLIQIDFRDAAHPAVEQLPYDFSARGYALCVVNTGGSHADLTGEYAAIPAEMKAVAQAFGAEVLSEVPEEDFFGRIGELRQQVGDRALLRALHFFEENRRVSEQSAALRADDLEGFFTLVKESGHSSAARLQNVASAVSSREQGVALGVAISEQFLQGKGACRVHGGGFAGTLQAYVPLEQVEAYREAMERIFGQRSCYVLKIRPCGGIQIKAE